MGDGLPLDEAGAGKLGVAARLLAGQGADADVEAPVREAVAVEVARLPGFRRELVRGTDAVC